jgi:hypothetical protein
MMASVVGDEEFPSRSFSLYWRADVVSSLGTYVTLFGLQMVVLRDEPDLVDGPGARSRPGLCGSARA